MMGLPLWMKSVDEFWSKLRLKAFGLDCIKSMWTRATLPHSNMRMNDQEKIKPEKGIIMLEKAAQPVTWHSYLFGKHDARAKNSLLQHLALQQIHPHRKEWMFLSMTLCFDLDTGATHILITLLVWHTCMHACSVWAQGVILCCFNSSYPSNSRKLHSCVLLHPYIMFAETCKHTLTYTCTCKTTICKYVMSVWDKAWTNWRGEWRRANDQSSAVLTNLLGWTVHHGHSCNHGFTTNTFVACLSVTRISPWTALQECHNWQV